MVVHSKPHEPQLAVFKTKRMEINDFIRTNGFIVLVRWLSLGLPANDFIFAGLKRNELKYFLVTSFEITTHL